MQPNPKAKFFGIMKETTYKEKVLKKIREALINRTNPPYEGVDMESSIFRRGESLYPDVNFAEAFSKVGGNFIFCANMTELAQNITTILNEKKVTKVFCPEQEFKKLVLDKGISFLEDDKSFNCCEVSITGCEALVARLGTIVMSSRQMGGRKGFTLPDNHFVIASSDQIVEDMADAFKLLKQKYDCNQPSMVTFVTGPSRTADIEKELIMGVHGPKELYLFLIDI